LPVLLEKATLLAKTDITPAFILTESMSFLISHRIVRPGYSTLQTIIGDALLAERERLEQQIDDFLDDSTRATLQKLLIREDALSELAAIKQDAKHFGYRMMVTERRKRAILSPDLSYCQMLTAYTGYFSVKYSSLCQLGQLLHYL
jgi:hypothetical protein